jgi:hypothetical protein
MLLEHGSGVVPCSWREGVPCGWRLTAGFEGRQGSFIETPCGRARHRMFGRLIPFREPLAVAGGVSLIQPPKRLKRLIPIETPVGAPHGVRTHGLAPLPLHPPPHRQDKARAREHEDRRSNGHSVSPSTRGNG